VWYGIPVHGPAWFLVVATVAFVVASEAVGLLIIAGIANLRLSVGLGALIFGPAAAFSGVTFPLAAMPRAARLWAQAIPLTHATVLTRAGLSVGSPGSARGALLALMLTALVALGLAWRRFPALLREPAYWGRS